MHRRSLLKTVLPICIFFFKDCLPSFVKMAAFWAVAYLEINKLPCLHEIDIPKCINVYSIYRTKLDMIGFFVLSFLICFQMYETLLYFFLIFTCMRGDTEKIQKHFSIEPISANPRIVLCSVVYRRCITQTLV